MCPAVLLRATWFMLSNTWRLPFPTHFRWGEKTSLQRRSMPLSRFLILDLQYRDVLSDESQSCVIPAHTPTISSSPSGYSARERMRSRPYSGPRGVALREVGGFWGGGNKEENIQNPPNELYRITRLWIHTFALSPHWHHAGITPHAKRTGDFNREKAKIKYWDGF